jgi:acetyl esterase/lipase
MNRRICVVAGVVTLALAGVGPAFAGSVFFDPIYGVSNTSNIVYSLGSTTGAALPLTLDVYRPTDIGLGAVPALSPAVVLQDGGAWTSASKDHERVTTPAIYLAQRGYTVVTANYRQISDSPVVGPGPWNSLSFPFYIQLYPSANVVRAGIEDFAAAIAWTRSNAATYGINPNRIAAAGGSAGGIDALLLTYNNPPAAYAPQAVVGLVSTMYGNHNLIDAGEPPAFLLNSKTDAVVLYYPDVPNMVNEMNRVGVYNEPWIQDLGFGGHDVDYYYDLGGGNVLELMRDFLAYQLAGVPEPLEWLVKWKDGFETSGTATPTHGDADGDLDVDGADFLIWQRQLGRVTSAQLSSGVPEPSTLTLVCAAIGLMTVFALSNKRNRGAMWNAMPT